ncbi:MAG: phosphate ABC transporter substrate-binding protein PstS [Dokdonella sp.]|nr:phosphate ABC transporter substrate-binding protein PstS [Dokdonella sp.]MCW5579441.1 phosphate ABC transporter substrate-binding protein PstS [Dokdonella sp.]
MQQELRLNTHTHHLGRCALAIALACGIGSAHATDITGAGSSFVYPILSKWAASFATQSGHRVNYQSIGSGGGIAQIKAGTVDFGATDMPLDKADLEQHGLAQFPDVIGGIVPACNVAGVAPGQLVLSGSVLADIFLGRIGEWSDPAIAALNPGLTLPSARITVVHRSDGSGTSFNFTTYLSLVSPQWKTAVGSGSTVQWPVGIGGKGNEGVAAYVKQLPNSIGYVEYAYAVQNQLGYARMRNAAGTLVEPGRDSFQAAAASVDWAKTENFAVSLANAPGATAWPITATSWVLMRRQPQDATHAAVALDFFRHGWTAGKSAAIALDYVPLPDTLVQQIEAYWHMHIKS